MNTSLEDMACQWLLTEAAYPLLITDGAGTIVLSNHAAQRLFGYSREEFTGLPLESLLPERLRERHRQDRAGFACDPRLRAQKTGNELQAQRRDGSEFAVEIGLSPIGNGLVLTTIQEITERKRAELALQQSEARFRATFEQAAVGIAHVAPDGRWLRANRKLCEIVGYSLEELLERTFQDITHPDDLDVDLDYVQRMLAHQIDTYSMEKRYIRKDGSTVWVNLTVALSWKPDGTPDYLISVIEDIQARKEAEERLRQSEEKLRGLYELSPVGILLTDMQGHFLDFNDAFAQICGYPAAELMALDYWALTPREYAEQETMHLESLSHTGRYGPFEKEYRRKDGSRIPVRLNGVLVTGQDGQSRIWSIIEDISERKRAEAAMFAVQSELAATLDALPDLMFELDLGGCYHDLRASRPELLAAPPEGLLGKTVLDVLPPEAADEVMASLREAYETGRSHGRQIELQVPHGKRWFELSTARKAVAAGTAPRFIMLSRDITERKRAEEALHESEEKLKLFVEHAPIALAMFDRDMRYLVASRRWRDDYSLDGRGIIGRSHYDVFPEIAERWKAVHQRGLAGEVIEVDEDHFERLDGTVQWLHWAVRPWHTANGAIGGIVIFTEDITERKRGETALQAMRAEMEQLMRFHVASQTVSALAHELNQPLNAVASYAEAALRLLRAGNPQPGRLQHAVESSAQQAQRAGRVVRELLAFMKQGEVKTEPVDLNEVVHGALDRVDADGYGGFQARIELEPGLAPVSANRLQVEKVLINLIENGIEAMRNAGIETRAITVMVRTNPEGPVAQVTVRDSGPGIAPQILHHIFDPFFTTKPRGLGMGLAISRAIIEFHGGQLWVESEPGAGASFHFTLPFAP